MRKKKVISYLDLYKEVARIDKRIEKRLEKKLCAKKKITQDVVYEKEKIVVRVL